MAGSGVRLTDLLAALSFGTDLGMGHPTEHVRRQTYIALRLGESMGLRAKELEIVYYASMLAWVGCHVDSYEQARWFGDEQVLKHDVRFVDLEKPVESMRFLLARLGSDRPLADRAKVGLSFVASGHRDIDVMFENHWRATSALASDLGLPETVQDSVAQTFERWDGRGEPVGACGDEVLVSSRLVSLADVVEVFHAAGGVEAAVRVARGRSGEQFDPALVELFVAEAASIFEELEKADGWGAVRRFEPSLDRELDDDDLDKTLVALADFVDLKSPYTLGHSRAVADLAAAAAEELGFDVRTVRRAGLVHDLGRLGVPNSIWDKRARLDQGEIERLRLHPYYSDRMLSAVPALAEVAVVAAQHHERLDGSGYPKGLTSAALTPEGRLLAVADSYQAWTEPRPHRVALAPAEAGARLREEVRAGRLDGGAVEAVLRAAGHRVRRTQHWPAGLTAREVEVLRLLARGLSHAQIAEQLVISRKTASNHAEHIYSKIGVTNRAMASLYAARNGLL